MLYTQSRTTLFYTNLLTMGTSNHKPHSYQFQARFSAQLKPLYHKYMQIVQYLRKSQLFKLNNPQLQQLVDTYSQDMVSFKQSNLGLGAIDCVHKLHPLDYNPVKVDKEWLIKGCLRQHKFVMELPIQLLDFPYCYLRYVQFLYVCFKCPNKMMVPTKVADFMWHSHMQDNQAYKTDMLTMLNQVLNHTDDFTEQDMNKHIQQSEKIRKALLPIKKTHAKPTAIRPGYQFINYNYPEGTFLQPQTKKTSQFDSKSFLKHYKPKHTYQSMKPDPQNEKGKKKEYNYFNDPFWQIQQQNNQDFTNPNWNCGEVINDAGGQLSGCGAGLGNCGTGTSNCGENLGNCGGASGCGGCQND